MESVRLQKFFTDCGILSRRFAEEEIRDGHVKVNGVVATIGQKIDPACDVVEYKGKIVRPSTATKHYILLYKPRGVVTTLSDEKGRTTVADLVSDVGVRVYPVGRLDMDSDGLLLLTDDGSLTERLTHPRHEIPKHYHVTVSGAVSQAQLSALNNSFLLDGYTTRPAKVLIVRVENSETVLSFELYEGRNRQIRRMCDQVGLRVKRLSRIAIGEIGIGDLTPGRYRDLSPAEVAYLTGESSKPKAQKKAKSEEGEEPKKASSKKSKSEKAEGEKPTGSSGKKSEEPLPVQEVVAPTPEEQAPVKKKTSKKSTSKIVLEAITLQHVSNAIKTINNKAAKSAREREEERLAQKRREEAEKARAEAEAAPTEKKSKKSKKSAKEAKE